MKIFKNISHWFKVQGSRFKRKPSTVNLKPLTIEGVVEAPFTYEPDDAELAAQALLGSMLETAGKKKGI